MEKCSAKINCGHICPKLCHANDRDHIHFQCQEKCTRLCPVGHSCPARCSMDCPPCLVLVTKTLECSHEQLVECHSDPATEFCKTIVWKVFKQYVNLLRHEQISNHLLICQQKLPICGHGKDMACGASPKEAECPELCGMKLECGHICPLPCHKRSSHSEILCQQPCLQKCQEQHSCEKKCHENCGRCFTTMKKFLPCGHEVKHIYKLDSFFF